MIRLGPALLFFVATLSGCAAAALPPSRAELGSLVLARDAEPTVGVRLAAGVHTASGTTNAAVPFDVGAGYLHEESGGPRAAAVARVDEAPIDPPASTRRESHGAYFEASRTIHRRDHDRLWLGLRTEVLFPTSGLRDDVNATVLARVGWELFATGSGSGDLSDHCSIGGGVAHGAVGVGAYVESGVRRYLGGDEAFVATGGVTVRLPFLAGMAVDTCFKWIH